MTKPTSGLRASDGAVGAGAGESAAGPDATCPDVIPDPTRLAALADEFARRHRGGERPSPEEYARRYPALAAEIRDLFPAIALMEHPAVALAAVGAAERVGATVGRYRLIERIGEGGFGVVFLAEQTHPVRRRVAVKVIKPGMDTEQVVARFAAERQALALMDHENIARVLDAGATESGRPYFVMELVAGVPITDYCDRHRLPPPERLRLFLRVCRAVQHAHTKGVIHRDIKPTNVLVAETDDGAPVPKVIDFGVAKALGQQNDGRTLFTQFAQMVGTPLYMSPEQAEMSGLDVDTRTDVYGLGVLLYELLTGTTPFDRERLGAAPHDEVRRIIREEEPPTPSTRIGALGGTLAAVCERCGTEPRRLAPLVRGDLDWIVMRCLEKDPARRYETVNGLARDVERYLRDEPVEACPPTRVYRFRKFARRHRGPLLASAAVAVALLLSVVVLAASNVRITRETTQKDAALRDRHAALAAARASERVARDQESLARRRLYATQVNLAMQAWNDGEKARALSLLETQRPARGQEDLRSFEWYHLWRLCHTGLRARLPHPGGEFGAIVFLADSQTLAATGGGRITLWDVATSREKAHWRANAWTVVASPDGRTVATAGSGTHDATRLWDAASGRLLALIDGTDAPTFAPDGRTLAVGRAGMVEFWDITTMPPQRQSAFGGPVAGFHTGFAAFVFSPDGGAGAEAHHSMGAQWVRIWKRNGSEWTPGVAIAGHGWFRPRAFSPDGKILAIGGDVLKLYAADTGAELATLRGPTGTTASVAFAPDGTTLATGGEDRTLRVWDVSTGEPRATYPYARAINSVAYSPDGALVAAGDAGGALHVWDMAPSTADASILRHPLGRPITNVAFAPRESNDPPAPATPVGDGTSQAFVWDAEPAREAAMLVCATKTLALSHDGRRLAMRHDNDVQLWDLPARVPYAVFPYHSREWPALAFSPDDRTLASSLGPADSVQLWDVATKQVRSTLRAPGNVGSIAFSPDGSTLVTGGRNEHVQLWDARDGRALRVLPSQQRVPHGFTSAVAFSPDGTVVAAAGASGFVMLWDAADGRPRPALRGHTARINRIAFSPDGRTLATASNDCTVRLWDPAIAQERATLRPNGGPVRTVAFSPDGSVLAAGTEDGTIRVWRASDDPHATAFAAPRDGEETDLARP